jgi:hypothetical protein
VGNILEVSVAECRLAQYDPIHAPDMITGAAPSSRSPVIKSSRSCWTRKTMRSSMWVGRNSLSQVCEFDRNIEAADMLGVGAESG